MNGARFLVTGRVQGVGFRAATRREAERLGVQGVARNLPDGWVEVLAAGAWDALDALGTWLRDGPPLARVDSVERHRVDGAAVPAGGFATG